MCDTTYNSIEVLWWCDQLVKMNRQVQVHFKGTVQPKLKFHPLTTHPDVNRRSGNILHKTVLAFQRETE